MNVGGKRHLKTTVVSGEGTRKSGFEYRYFLIYKTGFHAYVTGLWRKFTEISLQKPRVWNLVGHLSILVKRMPCTLMK